MFVVWLSSIWKGWHTNEKDKMVFADDNGFACGYHERISHSYGKQRKQLVSAGWSDYANKESFYGKWFRIPGAAML